MDDNMLLVTGIGFLILSALLVYLGVRLFMILFKKCEQNRKHQVIFFAVLLFIFACCGCVLFWDPVAPFAVLGMLCLLFSEPKVSVSFITMPTWGKILPALLIIIFSLCCIITAVILLIRKKFICGSILLGYTAALVCFAYSISPVKIMDDNMLLVTDIGFLSALLVYLGVRLFMLLFKKCEQNRKHQVIFFAVLLFIFACCGCVLFWDMDDNMLLGTGIGFLILSALLVYLGVRLFMLLFKKCEQNRKHLAIFIIIFLFVTAILCAATYLYDLFLGLSLGRYVCYMPHLAKLLLMLMPLLLFVIPFALSCFVSFVVLLIRKKLSSVTFLLCGILLCIFVMFHSLNKCRWCREVYWIQSWYMFLLLHHNEHGIIIHHGCSVCDEYRDRHILHRQSYCSEECRDEDYRAKGICTSCHKPKESHPIVTRVCRNSECRTVIYRGPECPTRRWERRISVRKGYCSACWEKEREFYMGVETSTSEESCLPKDDVLEKK